MTKEFDVIVVGSGMGGMSTAAALSRFEHRVALLEQAPFVGGLTHSFTRNGFSYDVGLHYCGLFGPNQSAGRLLDWLSDGAVEFKPFGQVYDIVHFPDGFEFSISAPEESFKSELKRQFPDHSQEIETYFSALKSGDLAMHHVARARLLPGPLSTLYRLWHRRAINRWCSRTTEEVIGDIISNPKLAAILTSQWGAYGGKPGESSFAIHALIISHYLEGARYPAGGAGAISDALVPVIERAGGEIHTNTRAAGLVIENGSVTGIRTDRDEIFKAPVVVSAMGAGETVAKLMPGEFQANDWVKDIGTMNPSICHFQLFLGFEGDITQHGATRSNHWFHESWDTSNAIWSDVENSPVPMMFVSFPSLKDAEHDPGPANRHTSEVMVLADWSTVAEFADGGKQQHPEQWAAYKEMVRKKLLDFFFSKYPSLEPLMVQCELGTPLATVDFTGHTRGGFYGIETSPRRVLSKSLRARTPIPGLFLSGQDVLSPGIAGSLWAGMHCAASIDPRVFRKFR